MQSFTACRISTWPSVGKFVYSSTSMLLRILLIAEQEQVN